MFVTRDLPGDGLKRLTARTRAQIWPGPGAPTRDELRRGAADAEGLLCLLTDRIDADLLDACPKLRVVSSCSVGLDHVDIGAASALGIDVGFTPGVLVDTTAELTLGLLLAASRRIVEADRFVRDGSWRSWEPDLLLGRDLQGATLGVIGLGAIGRALADRARALGMQVLGWSRSPREVEGVERVRLEELLERSDFVSLHVALAPETRGLLDAAAIARMRPHAILVNTARGEILDEEALARALDEGRLGGAALDVFGREPLEPQSPLLAAPNLILTPHVGSATVATRARMADLAVDNLLAGLEGQPLVHCANPGAAARREGD